MESGADRLMRFLLVLRQAGITDARVLSALEKTPRTHFAPAPFAAFAHEDRDLPLGDGQAMTSPVTVARMLVALDLRGGESVLEVGTGSGFQTAALAAMSRRVVSLERHQALAAAARGKIGELRLMQARVHVADGTLGWSTEAPFERVVINAAIEAVPAALAAQLAVGGVLAAPMAGRLRIMRKSVDGALVATDFGPAVYAALEEGVVTDTL